MQASLCQFSVCGQGAKGSEARRGCILLSCTPLVLVRSRCRGHVMRRNEQWGLKGYIKIKRGVDECGIESMVNGITV